MLHIIFVLFLNPLIGLSQTNFECDTKSKRKVYEDLNNFIKDSFKLKSSYIIFKFEFNSKKAIKKLSSLEESNNFSPSVKNEFSKILYNHRIYFRMGESKILVPIFLVNNSDTSIENNSLIKKLTLALDDAIVKKIFVANNISLIKPIILTIQPPEIETRGKFE